MDIEKTEQTPATECDKEQPVSYGKFKSPEELLKAYHSLEGEFTKRSQKLKEYEKKIATTSDWEGKVKLFVEKYPVAERYTEELAAEIAKDESLIQKENCLESALLTVLSQKVKTADEMASDQTVIEKVLNEKRNQDAVIDEYLKNIKKNLPKTLPKGGAIPISAPYRPRSILEAGELAKKIIENQ